MSANNIVTEKEAPRLLGGAPISGVPRVDDPHKRDNTVGSARSKRLDDFRALVKHLPSKKPVPHQSPQRMLLPSDPHSLTRRCASTLRATTGY
ncbi:hypothetical protein MTO96_017660 [Rhipicephalus appendiculatus]